MRLYGLQRLIVSSLRFVFFYILLISHIGTCTFYLQIPQLIQSKAKWKPSTLQSWQQFICSVIRKQYKQASTRVFLSASVAGGSQTDNSPPDLGQRDIITTNQGKYWITSDCHSERNDKCIFLLALECSMSLFPIVLCRVNKALAIFEWDLCRHVCWVSNCWMLHT